MSKISVFGLGYVGAVSAGCLANKGNYVIGVDKNIEKVNLINEGRSPIIEKDIDGIINKCVKEGRLLATTDVEESILKTSISLICVGTPSRRNGSLDLSHVRDVCKEIGSALSNKKEYHVVVCRSTVLPGSMNDVVIATLEKYSNKRVSVDFGICNNPEFLREGTAVYDFYNPPKTVIGEMDEQSGRIVASLYEDLKAPLIRTDIKTAEMVKYADNSWHALKVCFANEIGNISKRLKIDSHKVMDIFCQDTKLNLSSYYMKPGFAFGGSCLPKDVRALTYKARSMDIETPVLDAILPSNRQQVDYGFDMITSLSNKKIGILGFSFKAGTDDLRESPIVELIERLIGKGYDVKVYDKNVNMARLVGANRNYILNHIPHISKIMEDNIEDVVRHAETIVIGNKSDDFTEIVKKLTQDKFVVDLVRIDDRTSNGKYKGICW